MALATVRTRSTRLRWRSWVSWLMLSRATLRPAATMSSRTPGASVAGPRVATILVRRGMAVLSEVGG
jgi:hypothetical protein